VYLTPSGWCGSRCCWTRCSASISARAGCARGKTTRRRDRRDRRTGHGRPVCSNETFDRVSSRYHWEMGVRDGVGPAPPDPVGPGQGRAAGAVRRVQTPPSASDMLGSQRGHGEAWQVCLAHLLARRLIRPSIATTPPSAQRSSRCSCAESASAGGATPQRHHIKAVSGGSRQAARSGARCCEHPG